MSCGTSSHRVGLNLITFYTINENETRAWAEKLASGPPLAMAAAKRLLRKVGSMSYGDAISTEGLEQNHLLQSEDCANGIAAFFKKEKPVFKGR